MEITRELLPARVFRRLRAQRCKLGLRAGACAAALGRPHGGVISLTSGRGYLLQDYVLKLCISLFQFLHKVVDGICGRAYPRYQDYGSIWSLSEWMEVLEETMMYFKAAVGKNIPDEEVRTHRWFDLTLRDYTGVISLVVYFDLKYFYSMPFEY